MVPGAKGQNTSNRAVKVGSRAEKTPDAEFSPNERIGERRNRAQPCHPFPRHARCRKANNKVDGSRLCVRTIEGAHALTLERVEELFVADRLNPVKMWALWVGLVLVLLGSSPASAGPARSLCSPESIMENAADAGRRVVDLRAHLQVEVRIGRRRMTVPVEVYSRSPRPALVKVLGIPFQARRGSDLMIPTAQVFTESGDYRLSLAGVTETPTGKTYQIEAIPKRPVPGLYHWTLTVSPHPWLVTAMLARNELGESTRVKIRYSSIRGNLVPVRIDGQGDLLLKEMLPGRLVTWLYEAVTRDEPVFYRITFSRVQINTGLPELISQ